MWMGFEKSDGNLKKAQSQNTDQHLALSLFTRALPETHVLSDHLKRSNLPPSRGKSDLMTPFLVAGVPGSSEILST